MKSARRVQNPRALAREMRRRYLFLLRLVMLALVLASIPFWASPPENKSNVSAKQPVQAAVVVASTAASPPPEEIQKAFWAKHLEEVILHGLMGPKGYPIPEIQERYNILKQIAEQKYGRLHLTLSKVYNERGRDISAGCLLTDGRPTVMLHMPKQMEICQEMEASGDPKWRERFQLSAVMSVMHEMEHLAGDNMLDPGSETLEGLVENEKRAWERTCRYSLDVLVRKHHLAVNNTDQLFYEAWLATGKSADSLAWEAFIREAYRKTRE